MVGPTQEGASSQKLQWKELLDKKLDILAQRVVKTIADQFNQVLKEAPCLNTAVERLKAYGNGTRRPIHDYDSEDKLEEFKSNRSPNDRIISDFDLNPWCFIGGGRKDLKYYALSEDLLARKFDLVVAKQVKDGVTKKKYLETKLSSCDRISRKIYERLLAKCLSKLGVPREDDYVRVKYMIKTIEQLKCFGDFKTSFILRSACLNEIEKLGKK